MFDMIPEIHKSATKFGAVVTSIVLLAACSHKRVKPEARQAATPPASVWSPTPEPESTSSYLKNKKKRVRYAHMKKAKKRAALAAARARSHKNEPRPAQVAQVDDSASGGPQGGIPEIAAAPAALPPAPVAVPPTFEEPGLFSRLTGNFAFWLIALAAGGLFFAVWKNRSRKNTRRRLVFNS